MHLRQGKNSNRSYFIKVSFLKNFAILTENHHLYWSLFLKMLQVIRPATLLIQVFSYEYCEILKTPILKIIRIRLLLTDIQKPFVFSFSKNVFYLFFSFSFDFPSSHFSLLSRHEMSLRDLSETS